MNSENYKLFHKNDVLAHSSTMVNVVDTDIKGDARYTKSMYALLCLSTV